MHYFPIHPFERERYQRSPDPRKIDNEQEDKLSGIDKADSPSRQDYELPSEDISPEKAKKILEDGEINGKPLTAKQRGMFGAAAERA